MVGWHRAMAYMMTAEKMTAQEAKDFGLVFKLLMTQALLVIAFLLEKTLQQCQPEH